MDNYIETLTREEKLIVIIDQYITKAYSSEDTMYTHKLYLIFVGYHLKYFYPTSQYCRSTNNVDNIMQMFLAVLKNLKGDFIKSLHHKDILLFQFNDLVNYIEENQGRLEQIYMELKAQYEFKEISSSVTTSFRPIRTRL
ncbi:TPA: hypothetical protein ACHF2M_001804 [Yersinia enterocolitica]